MENLLLKRLMDFVAFIIIKQGSCKQIPSMAHQNLFHDAEQDTAVYVYGPYEELEHQPAEILVIKFINDDFLKVFCTWQGVSLTVETNVPGMGWDYEDGEFGLGGDWWKRR